MFSIFPIAWLLKLSRPQKTKIALVADCCFCFISVWLAIVLRTESFQFSMWQVLVPGMISCAFILLLMRHFGVYNEVTRYSGSSTLFSIVKVVASYAPVYFLVVTVVTIEDVPRSLGILQPILVIIFLLSSRLLIRGIANYSTLGGQEQYRNVFVLGADEVGRQLAEAVKKSSNARLVGFVDANKDLQHQKINGIEVFDPENIKHLIKKHQVTDILLTTREIDKNFTKHLISIATEANVAVKKSSGINGILGNSIEFDRLKKLQIEDLLGREPVEPNTEIMKANVTNKVVMVSGAGGSIGSELVLQLVSLKPKKILLVDQNELALYSIVNLVKQISANLKVDVDSALLSVCNRAGIFDVVSYCNPDTVFHTAAYKHVDIVEKNPLSGFEANFWGTKNLADAAAESGAEVFLLVSSDKAVRPTSIMGATKRLAELYVKRLALANKKTKFVSVRFGNVLGSSGSVVPAFKAQIEKNGPVTVTHPDMVRYFMTISEAANLVIQAGVIGGSGDVLLLDMGAPVKIAELARQMIKLTGRTVKEENTPKGDIEIIYTGLRPGEKMYEELLVDGCSLPTVHPRIFKACETGDSLKAFEASYATLKSVDHKTSDDLLKAILVSAVREYDPFKTDAETINLQSSQAQKLL